MYFYHILINIPSDIKLFYKSSVLITVGTRVLVSLKNKLVVGFVFAQVENKYKGHIKDISHIFTDVLSSDILQLSTFLSKYYHTPLSMTLFVLVPVLYRKVKEVDYVNNNFIVELGINDNLIKLTKKQKQVLEYIKGNNIYIGDIKEFCGLYYKKILAYFLQENIISYKEPPAISWREVSLTTHQDKIAQDITSTFPNYSVNVLHGITGSGKTEIYFYLAISIIKLDLQVLILVPEINLIAQFYDRCIKYFDKHYVRIVHSQLNDKDKLDSYLDMKLGNASIIIGTRMCVFTDFNKLGLIIVDEEHDLSYKQNDDLHYHARDIAIYRAFKNNIPIVLGSATPSSETLYNCYQGKYKLHQLLVRALPNAVIPVIKLIDLNKYTVTDGLTKIAITALADNLAKKELSLIFINKRGYAPIVKCTNCDYIYTCNSCSYSLVYHSNNLLQCHYCGYICYLTDSCIKCQQDALAIIGCGSQKIETFLNTLFPTANIVRVDYDSMNTKYAWSNVYQQVKDNKIDILLGTQMLVKGHDFPQLTLVICVDVDAGLYSYDYRAKEYLYSQLLQVAGRSGRSVSAGTVLIQTCFPYNDIFQYLHTNNYASFMHYILYTRKKLLLPPYMFYILLRAASKKLELVKKFLAVVFDKIHKLHSDVNIYHPVNSVKEKLNNKYRWQILLSSQNRTLLHNFINSIIKTIKPMSGVVWYFDVNPLEF